MEQAIDKFRSDIEAFLVHFKSKRTLNVESMSNNYVRANTRLIHLEIKALEKSIVSVVEQYFKLKDD